ncbi:glutathione S-transferase family protein [Zavarzinia sp. CC-PAN008]|uniref:glutathione S-transferase family protein n=1 Tax=Zavarzinia sp. CC-PAN008 TaxID=3243332 RepID=UPI003F74906E
MPTIYAFRWVPPFAQGLVRDLRVRWALEEAGIPYDTRLLSFEDQDSPGFRGVQPFGQVPAYEDGEVRLFESGAIVLHIAERSDALMPADPAARARTRTWLLAALNTIEPPLQNLAELTIFHAGEPWTAERRPQVEGMIRKRLGELAAALGARDYLEDRFTAGDLMMTTVLRILRGQGILEDFPTLDAYRQRCEARPAFTRALEAQLAPFADNAPG